jgi:hypothetical protein
MEHTPVSQTFLEGVGQAIQCLKEERIEPELVVATTNQGKYAAIHNTKA